MSKVLFYDVTSKMINVGDFILFKRNKEIVLTSVISMSPESGLFVKTGGFAKDNYVIEGISKTKSVILFPVIRVDVHDVEDFKLSVVDRKGVKSCLCINNTSVKKDFGEELYELFYPLIVDEFALLKTNVKESMESACSSSKKVFYRYDHTEKVVKISQEIFNLMVKDYDSSYFIKPDYSVLDTIYTNCLEWLFSVTAYMHDMYKFSENEKVEHGVIAAKQFDAYCELYNIPMNNPIIVQMREAIFSHSRKDLYLADNIFFDILCDADILSKYTITNIKDKAMHKYKTNLAKSFDIVMETVNGYKPKTIFFNDIRQEYLRRLKSDMKNEIIRSKINTMKNVDIETFAKDLQISRKYK